MKQRSEPTGIPKLAVIPGDGVGPEVTSVSLDVLSYLRSRGARLDWEILPYSADHYLKTGETLPAAAFERLKHEFDGIFTGAFGDPRVPDGAHSKELILGLRRKLDLYVNFRPVSLLIPELSPLKEQKDIEMVVFRENTEGLYSGRGERVSRGEPGEHGIEEMVTTRKGVTRILRQAFQYAITTKKKTVTLVDKSNVLRFGHALWKEIFFEMARDYPGVAAKHLYVDAAAMKLIRDPGEFDVIVTENMFGDILTDICAELQGGMGFAASKSVNPETGHVYFEPVHGSAPDIAGKNIANPCASLLTACLVLEHFGETEHAEALRIAIKDTLQAGIVTRDVSESRGIGKGLGTREFGAAVLERLRAQPSRT